MLGKAKVISYKDLEEARAKRLKKEATRAAKGKGKRGRKRKSDTLEAEEDLAEMVRGGRKRKSTMQEPPEPSTKVAQATVTASVVQVSTTPVAADGIVPGPWRAPVARMC